MKTGIIGATGYIGSRLARELAGSGHDVVAISRDEKRIISALGNQVEAFEWNARDPEKLAPLLSRLDVIVNLAGENLASKRWTARQKEKIYKSRVDTTLLLSKAILLSDKKPSAFIQISASGIYGTNYDGTGKPESDGFLSKVAMDWEEATKPVKDTGVRLVINRLGVVLGEEGMLPRLRPLFKMFMGGHVGTGRQWISWIHIEDVVSAIIYEIENTEMEGAYNLVSPQPVMQKDFFRTMGSVMNRPSWLHIPSFVIKAVFGQMGNETLLASQRVLPDKILESGFSFKYPDLRSSLKNLVK